MDWKSTKENPISLRPMKELKKLVDKLPVEFRKAKKEIRKLKNERI